MRGSRISGMGHYVPERVVTNHDLAKFIDTSDEWIVQRTGIEERRWVEGDVGSADLAFEATKNALEDAGIAAKELDMIIFATLSPDVNFPGSSCILQKMLNIQKNALSRNFSHYVTCRFKLRRIQLCNFQHRVMSC